MLKVEEGLESEIEFKMLSAESVSSIRSAIDGSSIGGSRRSVAELLHVVVAISLLSVSQFAVLFFLGLCPDKINLVDSFL